MIVCSCNVLSDNDVRGTVTSPTPPRSAVQVYGCLGCSPKCGRCATTIHRIMKEALCAARQCSCCKIAHEQADFQQVSAR